MVLPEYKRQFIAFLLEKGIMQVFSDRTKDRKLKSGRLSPWFVNIGDCNNGPASDNLANAYADAIINSGIEVDNLYGIPDKGVSLATPIAVAMARKGKSVGWCFSRKDEKTHGEATGLPPTERLKKLIVGMLPQEGQRIGQLDDVFTTGDAKYEARTFLESLGNFQYPLLAIGVDRQEVAPDGKSAIEEYETKTRTKVVSIVNATEIYQHLKENSTTLPEIQSKKQELIEKRSRLENSVADLADLDMEIARLDILESAFNPGSISRLANYLRVYGTEAARRSIVGIEGKLDQKIVRTDRSVIPACDVETLEKLDEIVTSTADIDEIGGYKVGFELGYGYGLSNVVRTIRNHSDKPIIMDHQKAGTDIPATGLNFARVCKKSGVDTVIIFPQAGPETERSWIYHALDHGLNVIVGGRMTHPAYAVSEGGFITDEGALEMYRIAARIGITNFVAPGNKPEVIQQVRKVIEAEGINPIFYGPGLGIGQGGDTAKAREAAGSKFNAIVGTGIYTAADMKDAALNHVKQLL